MEHVLPDAARDEYTGLAATYDRQWAAYAERGARESLRHLDLRPRDRLLDVGCGTGVLLRRALGEHPGVRATGIDLSLPMLSVARARLPRHASLLLADATRLPVRSAGFDAVVSNSALHYWSDPEAGIREIARVLRPGGRVVLTDWSGDSLWIRLRGRLLRLRGRPLGRIFRADELADHLRRCGFQGTRIGRFRAGSWPLLSASAVLPAS